MEADRLFRPIASLFATTYDGRALITVEIETVLQKQSVMM